MAIAQSYAVHAESKDTNIYSALKWTFGEGIKPELVLGVRTAKIKSNDDTDGTDLSTTLKILDGFEMKQVRGKYFKGNNSQQGEINIGYDFNKSFFVGSSVNSPYLNLGVDIFPLSNNTIDSYLYLDTVGRYKKQSLTVDASEMMLDLSGR